MARILIALGGNALGNTPSEQIIATQTTAKTIVELVKKDHQVVVCHGNGPQVGMINNAFHSAVDSKVIPQAPGFPECGAMSQGYIGYHIQNAVKNELLKQNVEREVSTLVTQVLVDQNDPGFQNPSKPIGPFLSQDAAQQLAKVNNWTVKEDAGRGWRRVVPSPRPIDVIEKATLHQLVKQNQIIIAAGGGGIPVYLENNRIIGIDAVIDKDWTAAKLAELLNADLLMILTAVDYVIVNYNTPQAKNLKSASVSELESYIKENQFAPGSMLPKVEAAINFVKTTNKVAYIAGLKQAPQVLDQKSGTKIYR